MATTWFFRDGDKVKGPVSSGRLKQLAADGTILPDGLIRKGDDGQWVNASRVKGLFAEATVQATAPARVTDDIMSWIGQPEPEAAPSQDAYHEQAKANVYQEHVSQASDVSQPPVRRTTTTKQLDSSGFIANNLMSGENILRKGRIHPAIFLMAAPSGLLVLFGIIVAATGSQARPIGVFLALIAFCFLLLRLAQATITYLTTEIALTNKRVLGKTGFLQRESMELLLNKVEGIEVKQGIIGRIFNFGNLKVTGTGASSTRFTGIAEPLVFRRCVQEQLEVVHGG